MRLTLAAKSQRALSICKSPMQYRMEKLLESCSFEGNYLRKIGPQASSIGTTEMLSAHLSWKETLLKIVGRPVLS